ncbi:Vi polysaccharide biosynthesis vipB tviC, putative [Babesia ovis]|uniref:Vi polysaccharide biosynthesis vipB tviC, putative n=1 Tax=Babesia ovis TaxID=5869 RepID=A0A9W5TC26_BABOV|nr:Vi polysaccharide biosynthesis vipB tviC, putative [Babesia ovis]
MDMIDFITSRKVLVGKPQGSASSAVSTVSPQRRTEERCNELKRIIRSENAKKKPCAETLKCAIDELRDLRRTSLRSGLKESQRCQPVKCLDDDNKDRKPVRTADWSKVAEIRKRNRENRKFVFYMPAGNQMGTDVSIGRKRLEKMQKTMNKGTYGPLDDGPVVTIAGVPQPMDRLNRRRR